MRRLNMLLMTGCLLSVAACNNNDERFINAYSDVLLVRMTIKDSSEAQQRVNATLSQYGYTEAEFRREFFARAEQPEMLRQLLDSARRRAERRLSDMKSQERHGK